MSTPFQSPPAGTEVPPSSDARYFYRRQVYSRNPVTDDQFVGGRTVNFQAEASGGHYLVPSECRIVAKLLVKSSTGAQPCTSDIAAHTGCASTLARSVALLDAPTAVAE